YDILGTIPADVVHVSVEVLRPGRTIALVQATHGHGGRTGLILRAGLVEERDTAALAGGRLPGVPGPDAAPPDHPPATAPGALVASAQVSRAQQEAGRAVIWVRTDVPLVDGEEVSDLARLAGLLDISNGMTVR